MNTKADVSINVIIVAIVGLIVLVVLVAIFSGQMGKWVSGTNKVTDQYCQGANGVNGQIQPITENCPANTVAAIGKFADVNTGYQCCVPETAPSTT